MRAELTALAAAIAGSALWGLSGTAAQVLLQGYSFPVFGLVTIRMLGAALLLLAVARPRWPRPWTGSFVAMAVLGLVGSQATYLETILVSNVTTATLLQFLFLPMVAAYELASGTITWSARWAALLGFAAAGTILLIGTLSPHGFTIVLTPLGLLFGLLSAASGAYYTIATRRFVQTQSAIWVTSWGFLVGGLVTLPFGAWTLLQYHWPASIASAALLGGLVLFVIVAGTLLAFSLFVYGLRHLTATESGVAAAFEPIVAAMGGLLILGVALSGIQYLGGGLIVVAVALLGGSVRSKTDPPRKADPGGPPGPNVLHPLHGTLADPRESDGADR
ncbi:MAG: DMT family transporter [Thermoplasmata archaeon]|jgi:drug/metabolite transporter (DMT)-like permease